MHLLIIGGSDAGISAALRAQELKRGAEITVLVADDYPNFSICGLPYFLSGETPDWRSLCFGGLNGAGALARIEGVESSRRVHCESLFAPVQAQNRPPRGNRSGRD